VREADRVHVGVWAVELEVGPGGRVVEAEDVERIAIEVGEEMDLEPS
jgi:hypothetical protein